MTDPVPWRALAAEAERRLAATGLPHPSLDARRIVERAAGFEPGEYLVRLDDPATERGVSFFDQMLERRLAGEPLQYVVGVWGFRQLDLFVDRRVLIPRPETEVVVERLLGELDLIEAHRSVTGVDDTRPTVADLGTGSGAIALSVAVERPRWQVWATDVSEAALDVARANLAGLGRAGARVRVAAGSWFEALPAELRGRLDAVVANPPYVGEDEELPDEIVAWEPRRALVAGPTGTEALEHLVRTAPAWLAPWGVLVLETAPWQVGSLAALGREAGFDETEVVTDLAGLDRALVARRRGR